MNTGMVRKIDELGRLVIPKEIRNSLHIKNGEDVSIFIKEDMIVLKKSEKMLSINDAIQKLIDSLKKITNDIIIVSDRDKVICSTDKNFLNENIDERVINAIDERKILDGINFKVGKKVIEGKFYMSPVIVEADALGSVIILSNKEINDKSIILNNVINVIEAENDKTFEQINLFTDYHKKEQDQQKEKTERNLQKAVIDIKNKYGKNAIIKGMNLQDAGTTIERNNQVGGHKA